MALLSRGGCNSGACHGNRSGKGGLKLSLRGENPHADFLTLTREFAGRRINTAEPGRSLLLLKPTAAVPHVGGRRFTPHGSEAQLLERWLASGALWSDNAPHVLQLEVSPREIYTHQDRVPLEVMATLSDGSRRNVTSLASFELSNLLARITPAGEVVREEYGEVAVLTRFLDHMVTARIAFLEPRDDFAPTTFPQHNFIDQHIDTKLARLKIQPAPVCDDATFLRRVSLDVAGLLPTAEEARAFVNDPATDKRDRLIDQLLARREYSEHWALKWSDLLRSEEKVLDRRGVDAFHNWIRRSLAANKPLDQFVRELLAARGSTYLFPEANFYRANRDPFTRAETAARLFLGVRLQCAKCHNHPFDRWTQDDYYSWAAWFARFDYQIVSNERGDKFDQNAFNGEQIVNVLSQGEVTDPRTGQVAQPRFLGETTPSLAENDDRSTLLAHWLTAGSNRLFLRAQVNWIWYHLMRRGLVEPIDDVRDTNPASHPELLDALADTFAEQGCDVKRLIKLIVQSRAYQTSAAVNDTNRHDTANYSHALSPRWPAETLLDAQSQVLGLWPAFDGYAPGTTARQVRGVLRSSRADKRTSGDRFLKLFGKPDRLLACECERSSDTTLGQALFSLSDEELQGRLVSEKNRLHGWLAAGWSDTQILEEMYWTALSRAPTAAEQQSALPLFAAVAGPARTEAWQDFTWALLHSREFQFRH
jgi:hypothetical protein